MREELMLTRKTLDRVWKQKIAYGDPGPHYFGQSSSPADVPQLPQEPFPPRTKFRCFNEELGAYMIVYTPYVGEEK